MDIPQPRGPYPSGCWRAGCTAWRTWGVLGFAAAAAFVLDPSHGVEEGICGGQEARESAPQKCFDGGGDEARDTIEAAWGGCFHKMKRKFRSWGDFRFFKEFNFPRRGGWRARISLFRCLDLVPSCGTKVSQVRPHRLAAPRDPRGPSPPRKGPRAEIPVAAKWLISVKVFNNKFRKEIS